MSIVVPVILAWCDKKRKKRRPTVGWRAMGLHAASGCMDLQPAGKSKQMKHTPRSLAVAHTDHTHNFVACSLLVFVFAFCMLPARK